MANVNDDENFDDYGNIDNCNGGDGDGNHSPRPKYQHKRCCIWHVIESAGCLLTAFEKSGFNRVSFAGTPLGAIGLSWGTMYQFLILSRLQKELYLWENRWQGIKLGVNFSTTTPQNISTYGET